MTSRTLPIEESLSRLASPGWHVLAAKKGDGKWNPYVNAPISIADAKQARAAGLILTAQKRIGDGVDPQYRLLAMLSAAGRRVVQAAS